MKIDLKKFKKISSDHKSTVLQHPEGHKITVAHGALNKSMRDALEKLPTQPMKLAEGTPDAPVGMSSQPDQPQGNQPIINIINGGQPQNMSQAPPPMPAPPQQDMGFWDRQKANVQDVLANDPTAAARYNYGPIIADQAQAAGALPPPPKGNVFSRAADYGEQRQLERANQIRQDQGLPPMEQQQGIQAAQTLAPSQQQGIQQASDGQQPQDMYGYDAYANSLTQGLQEQKAGLMGEALAQGQQGRAEAAAANQQVAQLQQAHANYQQNFDQLSQERQNFISDLQAKHIDPDHYVKNMSTGDKIATGIGLILGGMGSGITGQDNLAAKFLNTQINNDIESQKADMDNKKTLLSANMHQFGNLRDATDMTRVMSMDILSSKLKAAAGNAATPMAASRAMQMAGKIDMEAAPIMQQIAMRRSFLGGAQQGKVNPVMAIRAFYTEPAQQAEAIKELKDYQEMNRFKEVALDAFDKVARLNTVGSRLSSPIQSTAQIKAIKAPVLSMLSKEMAGKFTEFENSNLDSMFKGLSNDKNTTALKRSQLLKTLGEKMNYPTLEPLGIVQRPQASRFDESGQKKIQMGAPVVK